MRNPRNQLIIAMVFALLLGLIIVVAAKCSTTGASTPARTATPKTSVTPGKVTGTPSVIAGRSTDVAIIPPGGQPVPTATPISVGPLPVTSPVAGGTTVPGTQPAPTVAVAAPPPVVQPAATVVVPAGGITYTVKKGDTLGAIARTYGTTTAMLVAANGLANPNSIYVGQKLRIPGVTSSVTTGATATSTRTYIVQKGDSLSKIAVKYGTTVSALVKANNLKNASLIYVGQKLIIP